MKTAYFVLTLLILASLACSLGGEIPAQGGEPTREEPATPLIESGE